jgi:hypothetical protein
VSFGGNRAFKTCAAMTKIVAAKRCALCAAIFPRNTEKSCRGNTGVRKRSQVGNSRSRHTPCGPLNSQCFWVKAWLARTRVPVPVSQKLAGHSDPPLTANVYTHVDLDDQAASINCLNSPPRAAPSTAPTSNQETDCHIADRALVALRVAVSEVLSCRPEQHTDANETGKPSEQETLSTIQDKGFDGPCPE